MAAGGRKCCGEKGDGSELQRVERVLERLAELIPLVLARGPSASEMLHQFAGRLLPP